VTNHERCTFEVFVQRVEPRLRRALVAAYGPDRGYEATAEALAYAWEHWDGLGEVENVTGLLYRVGQSRTRSRKRRALFSTPTQSEPWFEAQRSAVVLVHGFNWTLREVGECTGVKVTTVQNHLERGLAKLRKVMKVDSDV
jgi:DNA-directed RNA polymerase specialized sigma24 family protein